MSNCFVIKRIYQDGTLYHVVSKKHFGYHDVEITCHCEPVMEEEDGNEYCVHQDKGSK